LIYIINDGWNLTAVAKIVLSFLKMAQWFAKMMKKHQGPHNIFDRLNFFSKKIKVQFAPM
jgi:hypothetical protein